MAERPDKKTPQAAFHGGSAKKADSGAGKPVGEDTLSFLYGQLSPEETSAYEQRLNHDGHLRAELDEEKELSTILNLTPGIAPTEAAKSRFWIAHARARYTRDRMRRGLRILAPFAGVAAAVVVVAVLFTGGGDVPGNPVPPPKPIQGLDSVAMMVLAPDTVNASDMEKLRKQPPVTDPVLRDALNTIRIPSGRQLADMTAAEYRLLKDMPLWFALESNLKF